MTYVAWTFQRIQMSEMYKWSLLGFEVFEIIILVFLVLTLAYGLGKRMCGKNGWISKWKESKCKSEKRNLINYG